MSAKFPLRESNYVNWRQFLQLFSFYFVHLVRIRVFMKVE